MAETGDAKNEGNSAGEQAQGIPPQKESAAPSEREIAESDNQKAARNRERFIYEPARRFIGRPLERLVKYLDAHGGAITAAATAAIAVLTYFLASYAYDQGISFNKQLQVMQGQLTEMKSSGAQTDKIIKANGQLAKAAVEQADIAKEAFSGLERPYFQLNIVNYRFSHDRVFDNLEKPEQYIWAVAFAVRNYGRAPGKILRAAVDYEVLSSLPKPPIYINDQLFKRTNAFMAQEESLPGCRLLFIPDDYRNIFDRIFRDDDFGIPGRISRRLFIFFWGYIDYVDSFQVIRRNAFAYQYDIENDYYAEIRDPDYTFERIISATEPEPKTVPAPLDWMGSFTTSPEPQPTRELKGDPCGYNGLPKKPFQPPTPPFQPPVQPLPAPAQPVQPPTAPISPRG